ncbi:arylsulfatase J-like isoform X2 [Watersipora subatra]
MFGVILCMFTAFCAATSYTPHIIIITADDIGYADVGFNNPDLENSPTPKMDEWARGSTVMKNYYVSPNGFSTRSALLTAKHPAVLGTQFEMQDATIPYGLDPSHKLLPEYLKTLGYACHAVGQWDLGFYSKDMLPTQRGYDTFYGSYLSFGDYNTHSAKDRAGHEGLDLHENMKIDESEEGGFKPELYSGKAVKIIQDHDYDKPLHLYVALQSAQIGDYNVLCNEDSSKRQMPNFYYKKFTHIQDPVRRCYLALLSTIDTAFDEIVAALKNKMMLKNSVVIFTGTSGGPAAGQFDYNAASNFPFRGAKLTGWEGAVRGVAMVYTDRANQNHQTISNCMFHVSDWIPTLLTLYKNTTGKELSADVFSPMYGVDQYNCMFLHQPSKRDTVIHFLYGNSASIRTHKYKYIVNTDGKLAKMDEWYSPNSPNCSIRDNLPCNPADRACLFDLSADPCEMHNIIDLEGESILSFIRSTITDFNETVKYDKPGKAQEEGDPVNFGYTWQSWTLSVSSASSATSTYILAVTFFYLIFDSAFMQS